MLIQTGAASQPPVPSKQGTRAWRGQPGNPDPQFVAAVLDKYATRHHGLAPIVIVADQLADPLVDSLCLDTPVYGNVETFINKVETFTNKDVLACADSHLKVINDPRYRTIAGYSHGGQWRDLLRGQIPAALGQRPGHFRGRISWPRTPRCHPP
ncbi:hypothetical protein [Arthrobacter bambusae]|uniref:hypothetical protein n=1 Tax=Arthrobacter bambusae TaxID=1338426 RepID=UPI00277F07C2|nr:hypothetical protein [Arthrobacter bambusae]MDQ0028629.1 hypothetical protein [Arthrobacter bambusae]MDQ0096577.1 hypothetical protein [Arthrobacter bambusae]